MSTAPLFMDWALAVGFLGQTVEDLADIDQAIRLILSTPKGSDPHRPEFGADLWRFLDWPLPLAGPQLIREITAAIGRWEPRVTISKIIVEALTESQLVLRVFWKVRGREHDTELRLRRPVKTNDSTYILPGYLVPGYVL